jgi:predicted kinase
MSKPALILFCGLPGSGKTTLGKQLAIERNVPRLCTDDWMADHGLDLQDEALHQKSWKALWATAWERLADGESLLFEDGLWTKKERANIRAKADELGVTTEFNYFDIPLEVLKQRVQQRNSEGGHGVATITDEQLDEYSAMFEKPTEAELKLYDVATVHRLPE